MASIGAKTNVALFATCQALANTFVTVILATTALVGAQIAEDKTLATLPHALSWVATMAMAIPASMMMRSFGRRLGFVSGALFGIAGTLVAAYGIFANTLLIFACGTILIGASGAFSQLYRFAASEAADDSFRSKAISLTIGGGVVAAFVGPELAKLTKDIYAPITFAGTYLVLAVVPLLMIAVVVWTRPAPVAHNAGRDTGRPLGEIVRQPVFIVAALAAMIAWGVMVLLMTATPLSMIACDFTFDDAAFVVQWHIFGMFAPSFFTGWLIARFGLVTIMITGAVMLLGCVAAGLSGVAIWNFWLANMLAGVGWNFLFVTATALLAQSHTPAEREKVQGFNDFLVFGTVAASSFISGWLQNAYGWNTVNWSLVPWIAVVVLAITWLRAQRGPVAAE